MNNINMTDKTIDITDLPPSPKAEIAAFIKEDTLEIVNSSLSAVKVRDTFYTRYVKRWIDIVIALIALCISLPINFVLAVITFFDVGRPIIFKQTRVGKNEEKFYIYKFRNMTNETDANGELLPPQQRVTKWGKIARKTSLDELLNFWSVLTGHMSIIGPRPLLDYYIDRLNIRHKAIYKVRSGLECPTLKHVDHALSWQERLDNYVWYVENCSFTLDIKLMFRVVEMAIDKKETAARGKATHGGFMGYDEIGNVIYTKNVPEKYVRTFLEQHQYSDINEAIVVRNL